MLQLPGSGVRRLGVAVLLAGAACSAPESSGLFGPPSSSPTRSEASDTDTSMSVGADDPSLQPPSRVEAPADNPSNEGNAAVSGVSPPGSSTGGGAGAPVAIDSDAGAVIPEPAADAGSEPVAPPEPTEPNEPTEPPEPTEPLPPEPECEGASFRGVCWYVGAIGASCDAVCATRGGFAPASLAVIGSPAQGGSIEACDALLQAFGAPAGVVNEGFREDGLGFGCHLFIDDENTATAWWLTSPDLTSDISDPSVRMVCGCVR